MPSYFGTPSVAVATTPTVVSTFFAHALARGKRKKESKKSLASGGPGGGPENELSYEEGLKVVRRFLDFASHHGLEEVQAFTAQRIPNSPWVRRDLVTIPDKSIGRAGEILTEHLKSYGPNGSGLELIGGAKWWKVRGRVLEGEWIEMQKDYLRRTARTSGDSANSTGGSYLHSYLPKRTATMGSVRDNSGAEVIGERVILYIHGGAFFFSSLDTHRYQIQRHCRKAGARAFTPAYRLAPQYPFPCGLLDSLAAYLYLIDPPPDAHHPILPTSIVFMGDSAGAGMVVSLLVIIREMGLPMPAGASLISPWIDLTHSMPSIGGWDGGDFIPNTGFHYKPSCAWPPLPGDGVSVTMSDGTQKVFDEQVQMYCPNSLLSHPLVSPVNLGSLGGLCPLYIAGGGAELLRDEIIYLAHKAAAPTTYPPSHQVLAQYPDQEALVAKYKPTKVHLQIYEGCCHVIPTLAITRSAKYMYRGCANFNIWAFTAAAKALERKVVHRAKHKHHSKESSSSSNFAVSGTRPVQGMSTLENDIGQVTASPATTRRNSQESSGAPSAGTSTSASRATSRVDLTKPIITSTAADLANEEDVNLDDVESECSSDSEDSADELQREGDEPSIGVVTVSGREPLFGDVNIVSERVSTHGKIRPFEPIESIPALDPGLRDHIGSVHPEGAIQKWLTKRAEWDDKYRSQHEKWRAIRRADRVKAEQEGFLTRDLHGERPPLCSLVGWYDHELARQAGKSVDEIGSKASGMMMMWSKISQGPDKERAGGETMEEIKAGVEDQLAREISRRRSSVTRPGD